MICGPDLGDSAWRDGVDERLQPQSYVCWAPRLLQMITRRNLPLPSPMPTDTSAMRLAQSATPQSTNHFPPPRTLTPADLPPKISSQVNSFTRSRK